MLPPSKSQFLFGWKSVLLFIWKTHAGTVITSNVAVKEPFVLADLWWLMHYDANSFVTATNAVKEAPFECVLCQHRFRCAKSVLRRPRINRSIRIFGKHVICAVLLNITTKTWRDSYCLVCGREGILMCLIPVWLKVADLYTKTEGASAHLGRRVAEGLFNLPFKASCSFFFFPFFSLSSGFRRNEEMRAMEVLPILKEKVAFLSGKIAYVCVRLTNRSAPTVWSL